MEMRIARLLSHPLEETVMYPEEFPLELGGVELPGRFVDRQRGPMCGFEAVENIIQLYRAADDSLSELDLIPRAANYGCVTWISGEPILQTRAYQQLLADHGIASTWHSFDRTRLLGSLYANRAAIVVVDAHILNPEIYTYPGSWHAIVLTNFVVDGKTRRVVAYAGLDSNHPNQERWWILRRVEEAAKGCAHAPVLATDYPVHSDQWTAPYPASRLRRG